MRTYKTGDRVQTPLGAAAVQAFEWFDDEGASLPPADTDQGGRVLVTLDDPARWIAGTLGHEGPYMLRNEIKPI